MIEVEESAEAYVGAEPSCRSRFDTPRIAGNISCRFAWMATGSRFFHPRRERPIPGEFPVRHCRTCGSSGSMQMLSSFNCWDRQRRRLFSRRTIRRNGRRNRLRSEARGRGPGPPSCTRSTYSLADCGASAKVATPRSDALVVRCGNGSGVTVAPVSIPFQPPTECRIAHRDLPWTDRRGSI